MMARAGKLGCLILLASLRAAAALAAPDSESAPLDREIAVEAAHDKLDSYWTYPWFDGSDDSLRRLPTRRRDSWWPDWNWNFRNLPSSWLKTLLWTLVVIVLCVLIYVLVRAYRRRTRGASEPFDGLADRDDLDDAARVEELPFELDPQGGNVLDLARHYYERGDYNRAIVYLYSHQLMELDRQHLIRLTKGKTNRQYLRELARHAPLRRQLERTMLVFEDAFFGNHDVSRERFEACWQDATQLSSLAQEVA